MATEFNTQVGNGEYRLQFETNNEALYLLMQSAARWCIDHAHMITDYPCAYWSAGRCKKYSDDELAAWCVEGPCDEQCGEENDNGEEKQ